jgi:MFS family permease
MILLGLGAGMAFNPVLLAAMSDVEPSEAGLASGVVNTSFMMGGALGLAILASLAASRMHSLAASGDSLVGALTGGYHVAFLAGAAFAVGAALLNAALLRPTSVPAFEMHIQTWEEPEPAANAACPGRCAPSGAETGPVLDGNQRLLGADLELLHSPRIAVGVTEAEEGPAVVR